MQATVGHEIHGQALYWGHFHGDGVEVTQHSGSSVSVDLDMAADITGPNPGVDIDFVLNFGCDCDGIGITVSDLDADVSSGWYPGFVKDWINDGIDEELDDGIGGMSQSISTGLTFCPIISVNPLASVEFKIPSLVADMSLAVDLARARLGEPLSISYRARNLGNQVVGPYTVTSILELGSTPVTLDVSHGDDVRPCGLEEARWTRTVTLPASATCNFFIPARPPSNGGAESPIGTIVQPTGTEEMAAVPALEEDVPRLIIKPYSFTSELTSDGDEITANNKVTRGVYVTAPDVRIAALTASSDRVHAGGSVQMKGTLENVGGFATGPLKYDIRLNGGTNPSQTIVVGVGLLPSMTPGETTLQNVSVRIPPTTPGGAYQLAMRVVPTQEKAEECDDQNNVRTLPLTVLAELIPH